MLSISIGPLALPVAPLLLLAAVWLASWLAGRWAARLAGQELSEAAGNAVFHAALLGLLAARLVHLALHAGAYLTAPLAALDIRDGGWPVPPGWPGAVTGGRCCVARLPVPRPWPRRCGSAPPWSRAWARRARCRP